MSKLSNVLHGQCQPGFKTHDGQRSLKQDAAAKVPPRHAMAADTSSVEGGSHERRESKNERIQEKEF